MREQDKCVHTEHCCRDHGCKYGDCDCPVWLGYKVQSYPCESCGFFCEIDKVPPVEVEEVYKPTFDEYRQRRIEAENNSPF